MLCTVSSSWRWVSWLNAYQLSQLLRMWPAVSGLGVKIIACVDSTDRKSSVAMALLVAEVIKPIDRSHAYRGVRAYVFLPSASVAPRTRACAPRAAAPRRRDAAARSSERGAHRDNLGTAARC